MTLLAAAEAWEATVRDATDWQGIQARIKEMNERHRADAERFARECEENGK